MLSPGNETKPTRIHKYIRINGERVHISAKSKSELSAKVKDELVKERPLKNPDVRTWGSAIEHYVATKSANWRPSTRDVNDSILKTHVPLDLRHVRLDQTPRDLGTKFVAEMHDAGKSKSIQTRTMKLLCAVGALAMYERLITFNPFALPKGMRPTYKPGKVESFTPDEEGRIIRAARGTPLEPLILVAFDAGARQGEIFDLLLPDFDPKAKTLSITHSKTAAGIRDIRLSDVTTEALKAHLKTKETLGDHSEHIFTNANGGRWDKRGFNRFWKRLLKAAKVKHKGFHSTRHTMATRLLGAGVYIGTVAERLGHSSPTITLSYYAHALPKGQEAAASAFDATFKEYTTPKLATPASDREEPSSTAALAP